ncbi:sigma-70 family RNA polymerase sigma factor [Pseudoduganella chitinolytica]|uniref:Sigma-70 family RNA polymerase sigma factor n=1 Tax=Pseudoduganella chitinolytica TaxID=34070 RepID=A0ABY8BAG3_9BURK|nr:sigma-70 family RNA polymerase sigma factor [Pseudoduganella chitinolytica]
MQRAPVQEALQATERQLKALMLESMAGNQVACQGFLRAVAPHLRGFLRRRMGRWPDEVEDLVQEALLAIHHQRHTYDVSAPLTSWLYAITRYKLIDWLRRHARQDALNVPLDDEDELFASGDIEAADARRELDKALALLSEQQRAAITHTKLDGWSVRETATALSISEASVKVAVHRGLKTLAGKLRNLR